MRVLEDPFWRRIIRRLLIVAWIPTLVMAAVGTIGAGSRASVTGFIAGSVILYVVFVVLTLAFVRTFSSRLRKNQATRDNDDMTDLAKRSRKSKRASERSSQRRHERDD